MAGGKINPALNANIVKGGGGGFVPPEFIRKTTIGKPKYPHKAGATANTKVKEGKKEKRAT